MKASFETYFVPRKNVIYERERARFNQRVQQPNEAVVFITVLASCLFSNVAKLYISFPSKVKDWHSLNPMQPAELSNSQI